MVVLHQVWLIARRSIVRTMRQPGVFIPPLTFPLLLMAVNSNGLRAATHLPGFPTNSFLAFFLPFSFLQGALFASGIAGASGGGAGLGACAAAGPPRANKRISTMPIGCMG